LFIPNALASAFISAAKAGSVPEMHSARTTLASLPESVTMPWSRLSTLTCSPVDRNIVDPAAGPCQRCQVSGRTVHS
jgi:hypothetical protein